MGFNIIAWDLKLKKNWIFTAFYVAFSSYYREFVFHAIDFMVNETYVVNYIYLLVDLKQLTTRRII